MTKSSMEQSKVVSPVEWLAARKDLLKKEKEFTRLRDELSRQRRELPWEKVEKSYVFDGPKGKETLADLFGGRSQLIVYHFMLGPDWKEGCPSCSYISDHIDGSVVHLAARDVRLAVVSRAPLAQIEAFKKRMGWRFHWVSSNATDFNYDYQVSMTKEELSKAEVYYNYTIWFKLTDRTYYGTIITIGGAILTVILNFILIPVAGYYGSSLATALVYFAMMVACYFFGQKYYPIPYKVFADSMYIIGAILIIYLINGIKIESLYISFVFHSAVILAFSAVAFQIEKKGIRQS